MGGLLSAYDLSQEEIFLEKAQQLADKLLPAFNSPTGIPYGRITLASGIAANPAWTGVVLNLKAVSLLQRQML